MKDISSQNAFNFPPSGDNKLNWAISALNKLFINELPDDIRKEIDKQGSVFEVRQAKGGKCVLKFNSKLYLQRTEVVDSHKDTIIKCINRFLEGVGRCNMSDVQIDAENLSIILDNKQPLESITALQQKLEKMEAQEEIGAFKKAGDYAFANPPPNSKPH